MTNNPFAGEAARLVSSAEPLTSIDESWETAAESCVLARIGSLRIIGGLPRGNPTLTAQQRRDRLQRQLHLWAQGCVHAYDEALLADIVKRYRTSESR